MISFKFQAIGTSWQIDIYDIGGHDEDTVLKAIKYRIEEFDRVYSRFREDSLVIQISRCVGSYVFPEDSKRIFNIYLDLYEKTGGYFNPLVGDMLEAAGYDSAYSLVQSRLLKIPKKLNEVMEFDYPSLNTKEPILLDFGAGGKGYLVDILGELLCDFGIRKFCIDAGGDLLYKGDEEIRVGLENPFNLEEVVGVAVIKNRSICGSAGTRRKWSGFNHIINPYTLKSVTDIVAVWVVAETALIADSIATCLFFVHPDVLISSYKFEYVIVRDDGRLSRSSNFKGEIFS